MQLEPNCVTMQCALLHTGIMNKANKQSTEVTTQAQCSKIIFMSRGWKMLKGNTKTTMLLITSGEDTIQKLFLACQVVVGEL